MGRILFRPFLRAWRVADHPVERLARRNSAMAHDIRNLADEELMQLVQRGDPRAFELLYDRHGGAAFSLAYRIVGRPGGGRGHRPGGVPVDLAQPACATTRRAAACAPGSSASSTTGRSTRCGAARCTTAGARRSRGSRSATRRPSGPTWRRRAARRRAACAARSRRCPPSSARTIELAYFGGFTPHADRRDARRADRHGEGPDAARARQDETAAGGGGVA